MKESEAWLRVAEKCVRLRDKSVFLCNEVEKVKVKSAALSDRMDDRLLLFSPEKRVRQWSVWWTAERTCGALDRADVNDQRALACCFLAAMAEEEGDHSVE